MPPVYINKYELVTKIKKLRHDSKFFERKVYDKVLKALYETVGLCDVDGGITEMLKSIGKEIGNAEET